jgi:hypothetical protein
MATTCDSPTDDEAPSSEKSDDDDSADLRAIVARLRKAPSMERRGSNPDDDKEETTMIKKGTVTPPASLKVRDNEALLHEHMMGLTRDKRKGVIKQFVKDDLFHIIKFINNESELEWDFCHFAVKIMDHMRVPAENRERWWQDNKGDAKKALQERRASIAGALKQTAKGMPPMTAVVCIVLF